MVWRQKCNPLCLIQVKHLPSHGLITVCRGICAGLGKFLQGKVEFVLQVLGVKVISMMPLAFAIPSARMASISAVFLSISTMAWLASSRFCFATASRIDSSIDGSVSMERMTTRASRGL
jgi:hypothetical protein